MTEPIELLDDDITCGWNPTTNEPYIMIKTKRFGYLANTIIKKQILDNQKRVINND
jgi:hypothetical protein